MPVRMLGMSHYHRQQAKLWRIFIRKYHSALYVEDNFKLGKRKL